MLKTRIFLCLVSFLSARDGVLAASASTNSLSTKKVVTRAFLPRSGVESIKTLDARGGVCSDTNPVLFAKIGTTAIVESAALFGILLGSTKVNAPWKIFNQSLAEVLASIFVIFGASFVGAIIDGGMSAATNQALNPNKILGDPDWYANLIKPSWNPPGWLFPIMWLVVSKPTQLCAISRMLKFGIKENEKGTLLALAVYTTHLTLGDAWNKVFFGLECINQGTTVISLFFGALLTSAFLFYKIDKEAGYYMLPTCGWVAVAAALQYSIYFKNK